VTAFQANTVRIRHIQEANPSLSCSGEKPVFVSGRSRQNDERAQPKSALKTNETTNTAHWCCGGGGGEGGIDLDVANERTSKCLGRHLFRSDDLSHLEIASMAGLGNGIRPALQKCPGGLCAAFPRW
jgi:hypothetical protein